MPTGSYDPISEMTFTHNFDEPPFKAPERKGTDVDEGIDNRKNKRLLSDEAMRIFHNTVCLVCMTILSIVFDNAMLMAFTALFWKFKWEE